MWPVTTRKYPTRAYDGAVLSDRSTLILPAELTTSPLTISAICPFWMPAKITSVVLFSSVRPKSLGSAPQMERRCFLLVETCHCNCTARFVNDLALGKRSKLAVHSTIGCDHHAVIRVID